MRKKLYAGNEEYSTQTQGNFHGKNEESIKASVLQLASCKDHQISQGGETYGLFTEAMMNVWKSGEFAGNYTKFLESIIDYIRKNTKSSQEPCIFWCGPVEDRFENETVLIIDRPEGDSPSERADRPSSKHEIKSQSRTDKPIRD